MDYPVLQERARLDLARRVSSFGRDVAAWTQPTRTNKLGLSTSQQKALTAMLQALQQRQAQAFGAIDQELPPKKFSNGNAALLQEMTGSQEVWRVFRSILGQLEDSVVSEPVKAAARIAADCYTLGILRARKLGVLPADQFRETPMVYLEAVDSPGTASRQQRAQYLSASIRRLRSLKLPLPIVLMPMDYAGSMWSYCCIHHEVGHNLDNDLGLLPDIRAALPQVVPPAIEPRWRQWSGEILADAVGIVLGGAGFALSLGSLALLLSPADRYQTFDPDSEHPPLAVRVPLIADLLRRSGVPKHVEYADQLTSIWTNLPRPSWAADYTGQTSAVADLFFTRKLKALADHTLLDLNPARATDSDRMEELAGFLLTQKNRPEPDQAHDMHPRLVPSAAQIAVWRAGPVEAALLDGIQTRAMDYLGKIPAITELAAPTAVDAKRLEYYAALTRAVDFGKLLGNEDA